LDADWPRIAAADQKNLVREASSQDLACVIYTSGSTGKPKGVAIPHQAVSRFTNTDYVQLTPDEGLAQASNFSFDVSAFEIWAALLHGARLIIVLKETILSPETLAAEIESHRITVLVLATALFNQLVDRCPGTFRNLNSLLFGGEAADARRVRKLLLNDPPKKLVHAYGPTETTTIATSYPVTQVSEEAVTIPIGRPIGNAQIYLLDRFLQPVPVGVTGEIHIGGDGLAREYLKRQDLTAEKFIPNPFSKNAGARLYKTGDLARYRPDGNIEFVGRADSQVKIRGFRIELGEIESSLNQHPAVREAVVVAREDNPGESRLVAYVWPDQNSCPTSAELRTFLKQRLPDYMVPSAFVFLDSLPLTPNGKIDHRALPAPDESCRKLEETYVAPRTPTEKLLAEIWSGVLKLQKVGIHDNFFDLGGHSLLATQLVGRIRGALQIDLPLRMLFERPTIAGLAEEIETSRRAGRANSPSSREERNQSCWVKLQSGHGQTSLFCFPYIGGFRNDLFTFAKLARLVGPAYSFYGLQARGTDGISRPHPRSKNMVTEYIENMKTLQPHGPYFLLGECFGAKVAHATAQQLQAEGENVAFLGFLDNGGSPESLRRYFWRQLTARVRYRIDRVSVTWKYFRDRTAFHLGEVKRLDPAQWLSYYFDKSGKALRLVLHALRGNTSFPAQTAMTNTSKDQRRKGRHLARAQETYWLAVFRYRPQPYPGRITVFVNEECYSADPTLGWNDLAAGGLEVHKIPGNHHTYITEHIQVVAEELRECLERASAEANGLQPATSSSASTGTQHRLRFPTR